MYAMFSVKKKKFFIDTESFENIRSENPFFLTESCNILLKMIHHEKDNAEFFMYRAGVFCRFAGCF